MNFIFFKLSFLAFKNSIALTVLKHVIARIVAGIAVPAGGAGGAIAPKSF